MAEIVLEVRDVSRRYRRGRFEVEALRNVSLDLEARSSVAIMGPSGAGKTTLLNVIAGLDRPTGGIVRVCATDIAALDQEQATAFRRRHMGFVFQFFNLLPTMTAQDNVALPLLAERLAHREVERRSMEALESIGLADRAHHRPAELSGGEMQRVAMARALVMRPKLLLADEPTGNLDTATGDEILGLLRSAIEAYDLAVVMVTHSYLAAAAMDRVVFIQDGTLTDEVDTAGATERERRARLSLVRKRPVDTGG